MRLLRFARPPLWAIVALAMALAMVSPSSELGKSMVLSPDGSTHPFALSSEEEPEAKVKNDILLDFFYHTLKFAKEQLLGPEKTSALFSILYRTHARSMEKRYSDTGLETGTGSAGCEPQERTRGVSTSLPPAPTHFLVAGVNR